MEQLLQHFRESEKAFVEECHNWANEVDEQYIPKLTSFLNPRERYILKTIVAQRGLLYASEGGFEGAENKRVLIYPSYHEPTEEDFEIVVFELRYPTKFVQLTHREVYGALMNSGIDRTRFGDIVFQGERVQLAVVSDLQIFFKLNFTEVGRTKVLLELAEKPYLVNKRTLEERLIFVSSLRLDAIVSEVANISRQRASKLIQGEKVKLNWTVTTNNAQTVQLEDMISIRQHGRFYVLRLEGTTKKDNIRLIVGKLID